MGFGYKRGKDINTQMVIESARFDINGYKAKTTIIKKHGAILRYLKTAQRCEMADFRPVGVY